jgi:hypothetical protein
MAITPMTPRPLTTPEWLIAVGGSVFIFALAVSAVFVPEIRWLHVVQALMYVAAVLLSIRRSRWGHFLGASTAGLWNYLATFASPLFAEIIDHPARPDVILQGLAWLANLAVIVGCVWGYVRLTTKSRWDIGGFILTLVGTTAFLVGATAILAPDHLPAFTRARHPHWPWTRS